MVGVNNFSTGRGSTATLKSKISGGLSAIDGHVIASFGSTGNLVIETRGRTGSAAIQQAVKVASGYRCAVVAWPAFESTLAALDQLPIPATEPGMRWTPGLAFAVVAPKRNQSPSPEDRERSSSHRGRFQALGSTIVAIFKCDVLDDRGRLDSTRRKGGWGALSTELRRNVGGDWTARAISTLRGLQRKSLRHDA
jgi:hypothetical protein